MTETELAGIYGISQQAVNKRFERGWRSLGGRWNSKDVDKF